MAAKREVPFSPSIPTLGRWVLGVAGVSSWFGGSIATFTTGNGAGAVALIAAGAGAAGLALLGRWPSKVAVSGNEFTWQEIEETLESHIETAREDEANPAVLRELEALKRRLDELQRTGTVAEHPAARYDRDVLAALNRVMPGVDIVVQSAGRPDSPDFVIRAHRRPILVETKWRLNEDAPFGGSTLSRITAHLKPDDRLLVVSNARAIEPAAAALEKQIGTRGAVVSWRTPHDDSSLAQALGTLTS